MTRHLRIGWTVVGLAAVVVIPLRVAEIAAAHHPGVVLCVATARDASSPTFAFSHANLNQGNLKDE